MATPVWTGDAPAVAQVDTATITVFNADTTYTLTIGTRTIDISGITNEATTVAALADAVNVSTIPEFGEITATAAGSTLVMTSNTPGKPFVVTSSKSGAGTFGAVTNSIASTGPNHWDTAANWDTGSVPVNADDVYIGRSSSSILYGLAQSAVTLASLNVLPSFTGRIGLKRTNVDNTATGGSYVEYRETGLAIGATAGTIDGSSAKQINLDLGSVQTLTTINGTGTADDANTPACLITGTHASNNIVVNKGVVGIGFFADGATTDFPTLGVNYISVIATDATVTVGATADVGNVTQNGGTLTLDADVAAAGAERVVVYQGTCHLNQASGTILKLIQYGGTVYYSTGATLTTLILASGTLDFRRGDFGPTITNATVYAGAAIYDPVQTATWTNGLDLVQCSLVDVTLDLGKNQTWARTAI